MSNNFVTIYCLTYNHALYIREAMEGFLNQETSFQYNIFIFDDASTDGTSDILREYKCRFPEIIDLCIAEENTYKNPKRSEILRQLYRKYLTGKYIAICEGDDCWTDTKKLQMQIEYLEEHPGCSMTAHSSWWENCITGERILYNPYQSERKLLPEEIIIQPAGNLSTASLVMKREAFFKSEKYPICDVGDYPLQLHALLKGYIYYFSKPMSVYRHMHKGSWSMEIAEDRKKSINHNLEMVSFLAKYDKYAHYKFHTFVRKKQASYLYANVLPYIAENRDDYIAECKQIENSREIWKKYYLTQQYSIFDIICNQYKMDVERKNLFDKYRYIVILGNGEFAGYIRKTLRKNNVQISGTIVTQKRNDEKAKNDIWEWQEYPYKKEETLLVIGVSQMNEVEIQDSLKKYGFLNVLMPMWFKIDEEIE